MIDQDQMMQDRPEFVEYPITLAHPHYSPSKPIPVPGSQIYGRGGELIRQDFKGTPERLPPVTANSPEEEEYYLAQGYERAGKMDPSAWARAHADAPSVDYVPQQYPMWKNGVLILTAQEDPDPDPDYREPEDIEPEPQVAQSSEAANLRAQMEEMNRAMAAMREATQAAQAENARLRAEMEADADMPATDAPRPRGRPRKVA